MQSTAEGEQVDFPMPEVVRDLRRSVSDTPAMVLQSQHALNEVLAQDDLRDQERIEAQIISHNQNEQDNISSYPPLSQLNIGSTSEITLDRETFVDIFSEINIFQAGIIKPKRVPTASSESECFIPIFPFMYEMLDYGESIVDTKNTISLHLQPETDRRVE